MKLRTRILVAVTLTGLAVADGVYIGLELGRKSEFRAWQQSLIAWGCMAHEARTGDIVFTGASCQPAMLEGIEP